MIQMNEQRKETHKKLQQIALCDLRISRYERQLQELDQWEADGLLDPERCRYYRDIFQESKKVLQEQRDEIIRMIVKLPEKYANILLLIYVKGLRLVDLAPVANYQVNWITKLRSKALDMFHDLMVQQGDV